MKTLVTFMLLAVAFALPSFAAEPVAPASIKEVQASLKADLTSIKHLYMTKLDPKTHADRVNGDGLMWVKLLSEPVTMEIATGTANSKMSNRMTFNKVVEALERGRNNAKLLGTVEGNKLAFEIDGVLKIIDELKKNPQAVSQDWPKKAKALLVYLQ